MARLTVDLLIATNQVPQVSVKVSWYPWMPAGEEWLSHPSIVKAAVAPPHGQGSF